jgi:TolB protein
MGLGGGDARRITYKGDYNTAPSFSPDCKQIAFESRSGGAFNIYTIGSEGGEPKRLTQEGSNESPSWSPDGRYIVFSSRRGGDSKLYLMFAANGKIISALAEGEGNDTSPAWSWWMGG